MKEGLNKISEEQNKRTSKSPTNYGNLSKVANPYYALLASRLLEKEPYKRLLFHGGAKKSGDNDAFSAAADNVIKEYKESDGKKNTSELVEIVNAFSIIAKINEQKVNTLQSVDFFTHSGPPDATNNPRKGYHQLYFKRSDNGEDQDLYMNTLEQFLGKGTFMKAAALDQISYSVFTENAKVEIHGCNGAINYKDELRFQLWGLTFVVGAKNMASEISKNLFNAGKKNAVVIGHDNYGNPNIDGTKKRDEQDYRHNTRVVYHAGTVLFITKKKRRITATTINKYLKKKEEEGSEYDGIKNLD